MDRQIYKFQFKDMERVTEAYMNFINSTFESQVIVNYQIKNLVTTKLGVQYFEESLKQKDLLYHSSNGGENSRETKSVFVGVEYNLPEKRILWQSYKRTGSRGISKSAKTFIKK